MDRPERKVLWLPAAEIRPNPMQPRRTFEETGSGSWRNPSAGHGILQPLTVRRTAAGWELVAGERRLRAAVLAGLETVPCLEAEVDGGPPPCWPLWRICSARICITWRRRRPSPPFSSRRA